MIDIQQITENLSTTIDEKRAYLEQYAQSTNPNKFSVEKQNKHLVLLTEIYNLLLEFQGGFNFDVFMDLLKQMNRLEKKDPSLAGFDIRLTKIRAKGNFFGRMEKLY